MSIERVPALMAAFAVALNARHGQVDPIAVDRMQYLAIDLGHGDTLRAGIVLFATDWRQCRYDRQATVALGESLQRCVERASRPEPIDLARRDIHG